MKRLRLSWFRHHSRLLILLVLLLVIGLIVHGLSAPVHGKTVPVDHAVKKPQATTQRLELPASQDNQTYFTLNLPAGYRAQDPQAPSGNLLYAQTITKPSDFGSLVINIGIRTLPEGGLDADPSYHLRTSTPSQYSMSTLTVDGSLVHIANDTQSTSVVAFWVHGSYEATISVMQGVNEPGTDNNASQLQVLTTLLHAWTWKV